VNDASGLPEPGPLPYRREETFLARYPRNLKLGILAGILVLAFLPLFLQERRGSSPSADAPSLTASPNDVGKPGASQTPSLEPKSAAPSKGINNNLESVRINDADDRNARMVPAPDPGLTEETAEGGLPRIGEDGRKAWQVYARPFNVSDKRPRIAIVMADMGMARLGTDAALRQLPANVTIAFDTQSAVTAAWLMRARQDGHETLLALPMEPFDFPQSDPGAGALLTNLPNSDNIQRLLGALRSGTGYVGVTTLSGSRFTADPEKMKPVLDVLNRRGLLVFDANVAPHSVLVDLAKQAHVPVTAATLQIDRDPSPAAIDSALRQLEQTANLSGRAIGVASPLPVTLDHLEKWLKPLPEHGIALAPLSAVVE
jgi:uncharacterized protein